MMDIAEKFQKLGVVPVVVLEDTKDAVPLAKALVEGGLPCAEVTFRTEAAEESIRLMAEQFPDMLVGAGTVLDAETARHAILNGAEFIIAPNFSKAVAEVCNRYQIPYAPGCTSLTEAVDGLTSGAAFIKAFPISDFYGPKLCKVFKTPIPDMPILASGGINLTNLQEWLESGADVCGFGSLLTKGTSEDIAENASKIHEIIENFKNK